MWISVQPSLVIFWKDSITKRVKSKPVIFRFPWPLSTSQLFFRWHFFVKKMSHLLVVVVMVSVFDGISFLLFFLQKLWGMSSTIFTVICVFKSRGFNFNRAVTIKAFLQKKLTSIISIYLQAQRSLFWKWCLSYVKRTKLLVWISSNQSNE